MSITNRFKVKSIKSKETHDWLLNKHYAGRIPSISWAFGLFGEILKGVCTFGKPPSPSLRTGIAGEQNSDIVYELNRLVISEHCPTNTASYFISQCLKKLPDNMIIVSFADTSMGHTGKIYQATNFTYTGLSAKRTDWKVKGQEHKHGISIADEFRGRDNRAELMRKKYGDDFYLKERPRKHRYVYFTGKEYDLNYPVKEYPKGETKRYDASYQPQVQGELL